MIFTTDRMAHSDRAKALTASGAAVLGSGETGVDGKEIIDYLGEKLSAHVIVMATGPTVLQLLLRAERLDLLYITQVQREIPFDNPSTAKRFCQMAKGSGISRHSILPISTCRIMQWREMADPYPSSSSGTTEYDCLGIGH